MVCFETKKKELHLYKRTSSRIPSLVEGMDSGDEDVLYEEDQDDSADESPSEEAENSDFDIDCEDPSTPKRPHLNDDFHYECLTPEALVSYMNEIIDEVNSVFQVSFPSSVVVIVW